MWYPGIMKKRRNRNLNQMILDQLQTGSKKISGLIGVLQKERPGTTKQGVYAALRALRAEEKVVLHAGRASLNNAWLDQMMDYFTIARQHYTATDARDNSFLQLVEGEKIQYFFRDPLQTDMFWSHAFAIFANVVPVETPLYLYNPHDWFLLARHENERALIGAVIKSGRYYFMTVGNRMPLDRLIAKEFDGERAQYYMVEKSLFKKENYYLNIFGDYLIEVFIDTKIAAQLDDFYAKYKDYNPAAQEELEKIIQSRGRSKLVISRNAKKAARLAAVLKKFFYIKRP